MGCFRLEKLALVVPNSDILYTAAKISPDGRFIAIGEDANVLVHDLEKARTTTYPTAHTRPIANLTWSPDSQCIATACDDFTITITHLVYGELHRLTGHTAPVTALVYTPKGNLLCSCSVDESIKVWDTLEGRLLRTMSAHSESVVSIDIPTCDASVLASGSYDGLIRVFDTASGHCLKTLTYDKDWQSENGVVPISQVKFSVNGKYLLVASLDGIIKIWDYLQGRVVRTFRSGVSSTLKYSCGMDFLYPADPTKPPVVVTGTEDGHIYCWDAQDKTLYQELLATNDNSPLMCIDCREQYMCSLSLRGDCRLYKWVDDN
ncbi:LAMI_0E08174g1_1 [Lachancea mirantina]|uniref:LAMI_0E08174g1_1 n=1 Tax=Lachancea mirantina TaxID=1230905 RepID=A0A1G4JND4_9SACH|nr:LAMI_0E08174g1_1 [Lachancea mirantina]